MKAVQLMKVVVGINTETDEIAGLLVDFIFFFCVFISFFHFFFTINDSAFIPVY